MKPTLRKIFLTLLILAAGAGSGYGIGYLELQNARTLLEGKIDELEQRKELIYTKYKEKSAREAQLMRMLSLTEGQALAARQEVAALTGKVKALSSGKGALLKTIEEKDQEIRALDSRLQAAAVDLEASRAELERAHEAHRLALEERDGVIAGLEADVEDLQADLQMMGGKFNRCADRNARLLIIADELVEKYQNKGTLDALAANEPFTRLQKVEMEKLMQDYQDRIDRLQQREK